RAHSFPIRRSSDLERVALLGLPALVDLLPGPRARASLRDPHADQLGPPLVRDPPALISWGWCATRARGEPAAASSRSSGVFATSATRARAHPARRLYDLPSGR